MSCNEIMFTPIFDNSIEETRTAIVNFYKRILNISESEIVKISCMDQRSDEWLTSRKLRLTASNFGAAIGCSPYLTPDGLLRQIIYQTFKGNVATAYGSMSEANACREYLGLVNGGTPGDSAAIEHREHGLGLSKDYPFLGASPDGLLTICREPAVHIPVELHCPDSKYDLIENYFDPDQGIISKSTWLFPDTFPHQALLEIKCPFRKMLYGEIPVHYYVQIQGAMQIFDLPYCHFYVWTPTGSSLVCYPKNDRFWHDYMLPRLKKFYFTKYMPMAFLYSRQHLQPMKLVPLEILSKAYVSAVFEICEELGNQY